MTSFLPLEVEISFIHTVGGNNATFQVVRVCVIYLQWLFCSRKTGIEL